MTVIVMTANVIKGTLYRRSDSIMVSVKVIETETSRIRAVATVTVNGEDELFSSAGNVAKAVVTKLDNVYHFM